MTRHGECWTVTVHPFGGPAIERGLFATPQDAISVFQSEVTQRLVDWAIRQLTPLHGVVSQPVGATPGQSPAPAMSMRR
ncbi:MAG: hypothetical protein K2Y23_15400 [Cyanobacteria bacterium]|nr:hypothetical protein [Cyanobacteriota bacterium]